MDQLQCVSVSRIEFNNYNNYKLTIINFSETCFDLQPLINGAIAYDAGLADSRPINTTATSTCDNDYILIGVSFRVCQNDGTWSGSAPTCHGEFCNRSILCGF